eukprot:Gb_24549 [translate_table: standard]
MEDKQALVVQKRPTTSMYDGSSPRKKKKKTKNTLLHGEDIIIDEVQWNELHEDILERVLARLPVSSFFHFRSVCKGWSSLIHSPSFLKACSEVPSRAPWFYMVDSKGDDCTVYDTDVNKWHHIQRPCDLNENGKFKPVASAGGLVCFRSSLGYFTVCNPLTACFRELPHLETTQTIHAITMVSYKNSYKVIVTYGEMPAFVIKVYDSSKHCWSEPSISWNMEERSGKSSSKQNITSDDGTVYFLNKGGNVVARDMRRNPSKEFSSILTSAQNGEEIIYFLSRGGKVVSCNTQKGVWNEFPTLLPPRFEYSVDLVDCGGRMLVVVLHEMMESATVRIWEFYEAKSEWVHVLAMPPAISHEYCGKKADINCVGYDSLIMICISSRRFHHTVLCNIVENSWLELPRCYVPGSRKVKKFVSAFSFEPRLEALV